MNNINEEKLSSIDRCYELIKEKHSNWIGISNQKAIEEILIDRDKYKTLYESLLASSIEETSKIKRKYESDLELLNEGYKQELNESIHKNDIRSILICKLNELNSFSSFNEDRRESDEEKHNRLIIEIKLLKSILGE